MSPLPQHVALNVDKHKLKLSHARTKHYFLQEPFTTKLRENKDHTEDQKVCKLNSLNP